MRVCFEPDFEKKRKEKNNMNNEWAVGFCGRQYELLWAVLLYSTEYTILHAQNQFIYLFLF